MFLLRLNSKIDLEISGFLPSFLYFILVQIKLHFLKVLRYYYRIHWTSYRINLFQFIVHVLSLRPLTLNTPLQPFIHFGSDGCPSELWSLLFNIHILYNQDGSLSILVGTSTLRSICQWDDVPCASHIHRCVEAQLCKIWFVSHHRAKFSSSYPSDCYPYRCK